jgi:hypothetical protein
LVTIVFLFFVVDISIEMPPQSKSGGKKLTEDEDNEYRQVQGRNHSKK